MSDIFENDIDDENENLAALEDSDIRKNTGGADENFVYPKPLYLVKLEYSSEGVYCSIPKKILRTKKRRCRHNPNTLRQRSCNSFRKGRPSNRH